MKHYLSIIIVFVCANIINAQDVPIFQWKEHLTYNSALSVAEGNGKVYCATTNGFFIYNIAETTLDRLSKVNGLSDVDPIIVNFNKNVNKAIIGYANSNIDIIDNGTIINLSDILRKGLSGNKTINNIYFINELAYLSCGFGIVVIDMNRLEVKDTYIIGPNGNNLIVRDLTSDATYFYAATDAGVYRAFKNDQNLANYAAWTLMTGLPNGKYNSIVSFNGKTYVNFSKKLTSNVNGADTTYSFNGTNWTAFAPSIGYSIVKLINNSNHLLAVRDNGIEVYDINATPSGYISGNLITTITSACYTENNTLWIGDQSNGLVFRSGTGFQNVYPNGPVTYLVNEMSVEGGHILLCPGAINDAWGNVYVNVGLSYYNEGNWKSIKGNYSNVVGLDSVYDILNVQINPYNPDYSYAACWGNGIIEMQNGTPIKLYNESNSSLTGMHLSGYNPIRTYGLAFDANANLWITNSGTPKSVSVKNKNGGWQSIDFSAIAGDSPYLGQILVDKNDQKWIIRTRGVGLMVYKGGTTATASTSNCKNLTATAGSGKLPTQNIICMAEDKQGEIWLGTDQGIAVIYSPENVFTGQNFDAQQILLTQDGHVQILLETEMVQSIAVDDVNRKWIATANSGVFLMSADGTQQIYHFTTENSPLFSNNVSSIEINHLTGEVYFATSKGLCSFRGTAIKPFDDCSDAYAFPNPVKHEYQGPIAIKGLVDNSTVKITDISGTLVYEIKSEGGQAIWYGKNFKGERVSSGVYIAFCTSEDGSQKCSTKILVMN